MNLFHPNSALFSAACSIRPITSCLYQRRAPTSRAWNLKSGPVVSLSIPARDQVITFGKYKGKMLGTLPSSYLKWLSQNIEAPNPNLQDWPKLAYEVLNDLIYKDRIEWEYAERVLKGKESNVGGFSNSSSWQGHDNTISKLLEISERFGWDYDDKLGWSKINFDLLGTSKGTRIPRKDDAISKAKMRPLTPNKQPKSLAGNGSDALRRRERRERLRLQRSNNLTASNLQSEPPSPSPLSYSISNPVDTKD